MARAWPGYHTIWRWHFYAGLFCIPFVLWLALTGSIYLFKPQIEAVIDRPYSHVTGPGGNAPATRQVDAALAAMPGATLHQYQLPQTTTQAVQIIVRDNGGLTRVHVHPQTLAILKTVPEDERLMRIVFRLHGELMAGDVGSYLVELAASWAIVLLVSGLFLWWPRGGGMAGIVYPRLRAGGRRFWRDLHAVTGFWIAGFALFLLLSGLPWSSAWGTYLQTVRTLVEGPVEQDWPVGRAGPMDAHHATAHGGHGVSHAPLDRMVATVAPLRLAAPVLIMPPDHDGGPWIARSDAANRPLRTDLRLDGPTGAVISRTDFSQRRLIDRLVGYGIAIHEGQLFGVANQMLNLLTALGLILISASGLVLWWRRRPEQTLGAPPPCRRPPLAKSFALLLAALGFLLPLLGLSLLLVLLTERLLLRRLPRGRRWLGLT